MGKDGDAEALLDEAVGRHVVLMIMGVDAPFRGCFLQKRDQFFHRIAAPGVDEQPSTR